MLRETTKFDPIAQAGSYNSFGLNELEAAHGTDNQPTNPNHTYLGDNQVRTFSRGLVGMMTGSKKYNEDSATILEHGLVTRVCVADGHWGDSTAHHSTQFWAELSSFPEDRKDALNAARDLENILFSAHGKPVMDENKDFSPEAAFVALELSGNRVRFISYGDCRVLIIRNQKIMARNTPRQTWIGAFSHLGLRQRQSLDNALEFQQHDLLKDDTILMFSDGIDECVYETPTLTDEYFEHVVNSNTTRTIHEIIMKSVISHGAEDNATLAILRV